MKDMTGYLIGLVLTTAGVTFLLRAFPFLLFGRGKKTPELIHYLGNAVSPAAIAMLAAYCYWTYFKASPFSASCGWNLPEIAAGLLVIGLHLWKRNALFSIIGGVILYMFLVQKVLP